MEKNQGDVNPDKGMKDLDKSPEREGINKPLNRSMLKTNGDMEKRSTDEVIKS